MSLEFGHGEFQVWSLVSWKKMMDIDVRMTTQDETNSKAQGKGIL